MNNMFYNLTPFTVHYEKIHIHLRELTTNSEDAFISAKKRTFVHNSDSITIFEFLFTFNRDNKQTLKCITIH